MQKHSLIFNIAKQAIQDEFDYTDTIDIKKLTKENLFLKEDGAAFVTLTQNDKLRGCIGSLIANRPLIEDIISNAKNAAFRDPRFAKLTREEFAKTDIEVSVLTKPKLLEYDNIEDLKNKIRPNIDGVILKLNSNQATFLPQVWEELPSFESFFGHLLQKAGLPMDSFKSHPQIFIYQVQKYSDLS
jgi:AmmeMemoRadiSam system protein A